MKQYIVIKESAQSPANYLNILSNYYYNFNKTRALRRLDNIALLLLSLVTIVAIMQISY